MAKRRTPDDVPLRRVVRKAKAVSEAMAMHVQDHETRLHADQVAEMEAEQWPPVDKAESDQPSALPFQGRTTPDEILAAVVERMAIGQESLSSLADELGIPYARLARDMTLYEARVAAGLKREAELILQGVPTPAR